VTKSGYGHLARDPSILEQKTVVMEPSFYVRSFTAFGKAVPQGKFLIELVIAELSPREGPTVQGSQSSLTTILSIWNYMIGSAVLVLPWAFKESGLIGGISTKYQLTLRSCFVH